LIDDDGSKRGRSVEGIRVRGGSESLLPLIREESVTDLIVAIQGSMNGSMFQSLLDAQQLGVEISRMPVIYEELLGKVPIRHLESDWLLRSFVDELRVNSVYLLAKRVLDIAGALGGLLVFAIVLPWAAAAILAESGRPVIFRQSRLGQGGKVFSVVKLRTMRQDAEADGQARWANTKDERVTRVGIILRRMHIDEFPQFWNVLRGEMSLVGPRPERPELVRDLEQQIPFYRARLLVKPGLSGWAQVSYGKGASYEGSAEKLEYDLFYIKHRSLGLDLRIMLRTFGSVFGLKGV
jgi:exopolysaccharide biosynthesis polyprenyl glycosylphosphotransferase